MNAPSVPERTGWIEPPQPVYVPPRMWTVSPGWALLTAELTEAGESALVPSPLPSEEAYQSSPRADAGTRAIDSSVMAQAGEVFIREVCLTTPRSEPIS